MIGMKDEYRTFKQQLQDVCHFSVFICFNWPTSFTLFIHCSLLMDTVSYSKIREQGIAADVHQISSYDVEMSDIYDIILFLTLFWSFDTERILGFVIIQWCTNILFILV